MSASGPEHIYIVTKPLNDALEQDKEGISESLASTLEKRGELIEVFWYKCAVRVHQRRCNPLHRYTYNILAGGTYAYMYEYMLVL